MTLSLTLLGGFALEGGGARLPLLPRKGRALLAALALARRRALPRARLAALLWERSDPDQARTSLRQLLTQLRRAGIDLDTPDAEVVTLPPQVAVDVDAFTEALTRGETAEAARLYGGDFMEGQTYRDPSIEEWLRGERTRLRDLAIGALRAELDRLDGRGEAASVAHRLLALDPLHEAAHRCLMKLDAARGAPAAAQTRFHALSELLRRELDTTPEAETRDLFERIRAGQAGDTATSRDAKAPGKPLPDVHLRRIVVLAALDTGEEEENARSDWLAITAQRVEAAGGAVIRREPGQIIAAWGLERTSGAAASVASALAQSLAAELGPVASFGLLEAAVVSEDDTIELGRVPHRGLRLAASAAAGELAIEPGLRHRLDQAGTSSDERPAALFFGRETEIAQILGAAHAALQAGTGLVVHITGEAGIGKTRLTQEIAIRLADDGVTSVVLGFDAFGAGTPHVGERIAAALPQLGPAEVADATDRAVLKVLRGHRPGVEDQLHLSSLVPDERRRRDLAMTRYLLGAATGTGLFLVIEDCHWASDAAKAFLLDLADMAAETPIVFLFSERPGDDTLAPRLAARGRFPLTRLALAPLAPAAADALARSRNVAEEKTSRALARAGGHPLFLLRLLESEWSEDTLPPTVIGLVQEQIERLPIGERSALRRASILGRRLRPKAFADIFGDAPPATTGDLLIRDGETLAFGHDLIHRAIYESVPLDVRQELHGRAAAYFRDRDPLIWADHALLSSDDAEACRAAAAAANAMIATRRFRGVTAYVEAALARDGDPEAMAEIHSCRASVRRIRGDLSGALEDYRAAYGKAVAQTTQVAMLVRMALMLHRLDRGIEADRALDDAEAIADRAGLGGVARAEIHEQRGNRAFVAGDPAACAHHHAAALAYAEEAGDQRQVARAQGGLGDAAYAAGRMRTAYSHFARAVEIAEQGGFGVVLEEFGFMRAYALHFADPGPEAVALADLAVERAISSGAARTEMISRQIRAEMRLSAYNLSGAAEDLRRCSELLAADPEARFTDDLTSTQALLLYRGGDRGGAEALVRPVLARAGSNRHAGGFQFGLAALVLDNADEREAAVRLGTELVTSASLSHGILWFHRLVLESAVVNRQAELASAQIAALQAYTAEEPLGWVDLAIENGMLFLQRDQERLARHLARASTTGIKDLPRLA